ncbi:biotin transporter BioY [Salinibacterium hongtaonis]|uniref:Biotin transporter BioY n=1 Tax=Homoserinimonas hongtaonis TaxID=2079791 RepID=A0A2U1SYG2_9MICO|nr:biotin transporter BioY [Salinibacterium hongtaonis]PWB96670.1 biotin transporter BioY [Salinibacterium hongtaonis]
MSLPNYQTPTQRLLASTNKRRLHVGPATLLDRVYPPTLVMDAVLVGAGAALIGILAQVVVPLWPVPSTGQIVGVLVVSFALGVIRGPLAVALYLLLGGFGLPMFTQAGAGWSHIAGQTGGYLVGFLFAAVVAGIVTLWGWERKFWSALAVSCGATLLVYAIGVVWLAHVNDYGLAEALEQGLYPLIVGGGLKSLLVAALVPFAWFALQRADSAVIAAQRNPATPRLRP